jgi:cytochrome c oxidase assembly protein subunit 11
LLVLLRSRQIAPQRLHSSSQQPQQHPPIDAAQRSAHEYYARRMPNANRPGLWTRLTGRKPKPKAALSPHQRNVNTAWYAMAIAVGALGAAYAAIPLYKVFCQTTGFGGTTQRVMIDGGGGGSGGGTATTIEQFLQQTAAALLPAGTAARVHTWTDADAVERLKALKPVANADLITIRFDTTVTDTLPWSFVPVQLDVKVVPGETALSFFRVTNRSDRAITGVATYNVYPPKVGLYFQKIQCFCFEEQRLLPGETVDMPVFFFIDPEMLEDSQVSYVRSVTLAYTFFQTDVDDDIEGDDDDDSNNDDENKRTANAAA